MANPTAIEDYVKVIYAHTEWQSEPITTNALAARLGLAASSVTEMVKKLVAQGLAEHERYGAITLTTGGTELALRMLRRHRIVETWLVQTHGYRWDEVHDEAEVLEHALSDKMLGLIDRQLGFPVSDPHGDPIPGADLTVQVPDASLLASAREGTVVRISDRDPSLLRELASAGVDIGVSLRVIAADDALVVEVDGESATLDPATLDAVWVATP